MARNSNWTSMKERIRDDLLAGRKITPLDALERYGCMSLAQRIKDLRNEGMDIVTYHDPHNLRHAKYALNGV